MRHVGCKLRTQHLCGQRCDGPTIPRSRMRDADAPSFSSSGGTSSTSAERTADERQRIAGRHRHRQLRRADAAALAWPIVAGRAGHRRQSDSMHPRRESRRNSAP